MIKPLSRFLYVLGDAKVELFSLSLASIIASILEAIGIGLIGPFLRLALNPETIQNIALLNWFYKHSGVQSNKQFIAILGLCLAIIFCIKSVAYFFMKSYIYNFSYRQKCQLCSRLMRTYLTVPYTFFLKNNTSSIIRNILIETDKFCYQLLISVLEASANLLVIFVLIFLLAQTDPIFFVITLAVILPVFSLFYLLRNKFSHWGEIASESRNEMIRIINHSLGGVKETRIIGCEQYFEKLMDESASKYTVAESLFQSAQLIPRIAIETTLILFLILLVCIYQLFFEQSVQNLIPTLSIFAIASIRLIPAASQFISLLGYIQGCSHSMDVIYLDLLEAKQYENSMPVKLSSFEKNSRSNLKSSEKSSMTFQNRIDLNKVTYNYPNTPSPALSGITLSLKKGESIALIGKSGAGKTTLVDVLLGLLQPESGNICVDGVSVYEDIRSWQNLIGYIPQTIFLIDDTLERNIAFGVPDNLIDSNKLNQAIEASQLTDLIAQLPEGVKTVLGERGIRLSGGQRQRIGIARALYHEKEVLVLDEATSALDNETESLVTEAIKALSRTKTMIIIAHRLTTVGHCDRIYLLEGGRIVKSGSYEEVVLAEQFSSSNSPVSDNSFGVSTTLSTT